MKKTLFLAAAAALLATSCNSDLKLAQGQAYFKYFSYTGNDPIYEENRLAEGEIFNPILQGGYSDASLCRKGSDYYMITSNYTFFPGIPVLHSKDLVNWEQICYALPTEQQLLNTSLRADQGVYPGTIRYNEKEDMFYILCTLVGGGGHFVIKAKDPQGPWSNPEWLYGLGGVHPSILFDDDGKSYIVNQGNPNYAAPYTDYKVLWLQEFDTQTMKAKGDRSIILAGGDLLDKKPSWLEAPHIFKKNGFYYLIASEGGGLGNGYAECVYRSTNIWGPYEHYAQNPILTQRRLSPGREEAVTCTGHVDMVDTPEGDWWSVFVGVRPYSATNDYNHGRETFLYPVTWDGEWPYLIRNGEPIASKIKAPKGVKYAKDSVAFAKYIPHGNFTYVENFNTEALPLHWSFLRTPISAPVIPNGEEGLFIPLENNNIRSERHASFAAIRQMHNKFSMETEMHFMPQNKSEFAGLALYLNDIANYEFGVTMVDDSYVLRVQKANKVDDAIEKVDIKVKRLDETFCGKVILRVERCDDGFAFQYKLNQEDKFVDVERQVSVEYLSLNRQGGFYGTSLGVYASQVEND